MRSTPSRAELLALLGAHADATVAVASRAYLDRRRELLTHDPDWRRPQVAQLDDAFARLRAAADVEARLARYQPARVRIGMDDATIVVTPAALGVTDGDFPFPDAAPVHVLTAFNPGSRPLRPHENASRQRALAARIAATGLPSWPAVGGDEATSELSIAVAGLSTERARTLAAEFHQDAIIEWTPAAWLLVPCDDLVAPRELGWQVTRVASPLPDPLAVRTMEDAASGTGVVLAATLIIQAEAAEAEAIVRARSRAGESSSRTVAESADPAEPSQSPASCTGPASPSDAPPPAEAAPATPVDEPTSPRPASAAKGDASTAPREHGGGSE